MRIEIADTPEREQSFLKCECGTITGVLCQSGPLTADQATLVEWMPAHLRASHEAAGNCGTYPGNGAVRLRIETATCLDVVTHIYDDDGDTERDPWTTVLCQ